jgi:aconitase B
MKFLVLSLTIVLSSQWVLASSEGIGCVVHGDMVTDEEVATIAATMKPGDYPGLVIYKENELGDMNFDSAFEVEDVILVKDASASLVATVQEYLGNIIKINALLTLKKITGITMGQLKDLRSLERRQQQIQQQNKKVVQRVNGLNLIEATRPYTFTNGIISSVDESKDGSICRDWKEIDGFKRLFRQVLEEAK